MNFIPFHFVIVDSGAWAALTPTAQALYPVLRSLAKLHGDDELGTDYSGSGWICEDDFDEHLKGRKWDILRKSHYGNQGRLAALAGISRRSLPGATESLSRAGLLSPLLEVKGAVQVWLVPNGK